MLWRQSEYGLNLIYYLILFVNLKLQIKSELFELTGRDIDLIELRYVDTIFQEEIIKSAQRILTVDRLGCEIYEDYICCSAMLS